MNTTHRSRAGRQSRRAIATEIMRRSIVLTALATCLVLPAQAQRKVGTTAATFLTLGTGARGVALGDAYMASARGADALFWNPAGMAIPVDDTPMGSIFFTNYDWVVDIGYNAVGFSLPVASNRMLGVSFAKVDYGRMDVTTLDEPDGTGERFGASDMVFGLSYAQPLTNQFYFGGTAKYVSQKIWDMSANTVAIDIGFVLITRYVNGIRLAATMQNFGGKMQMDGVNTEIFVDPFNETDGNNESIPVRYKLDEWSLPISFKFGIAVPVVKTKFVQWELMAESHQTNDQYLNADVGSELRFMFNGTNLNFRAGYRDLPLNDIDTHAVFGAGLDTPIRGLRFGFDAAYIPFDRLGSATLIDLRLSF